MDSIKELMERMTAIAHGVSVRDYEMMKGAAEQFEATGSFEKAQWGRGLAKIASALLEHQGESNTEAFILYDKLSKVAQWHDGYNQLVDIVEDALGAAAIKSASMRSAAGTVAGGAALTPEALRWLIGLSAAGGAGLGGLAWMMRRDSSENDNEIEALEEKRKYYSQVTDDIKGKLRDRSSQIVS